MFREREQSRLDRGQSGEIFVRETLSHIYPRVIFGDYREAVFRYVRTAKTDMFGARTIRLDKHIGRRLRDLVAFDKF